MRSFILPLCAIICQLSVAQQPQLVQPGIVSTGGVFGYTLSPNGNEAFWVQSNESRDTLIILYSVKSTTGWSTPLIASFSGNYSWKDIDPMFSPDGNTILFQSNRPVPNQPERKGFDIWAVKRISTGWSEPFHLGNEINSDASESFASITHTGNIYFMKENPDGKGSSDIYVSRFVNGKYQIPENIGTPINTSFRESNPYISPKEDYLIYFSSDTTGLGDVDLFISFKQKGKWSNPVSLDAPINTTIGEFCPFYHAKEKKLYFSRTTVKTTGRREENIYSVDFEPMKLGNKKSEARSKK